ncbi:hypothetical protein Lal_00003528 [Lupinus albus]|nr:hypothetical protein Lal_00003528 [Lupinus albus]
MSSAMNCNLRFVTILKEYNLLSDSRLSEKGSLGRVKSWAIQEDSRLSESCLAWARNDILGLLRL